MVDPHNREKILNLIKTEYLSMILEVAGDEVPHPWV